MIQLTASQKAEVRRTAKSLRACGAISATLSMPAPVGPIVVKADGSVEPAGVTVKPEPVGRVETLVAIEWDSRNVGVDELIRQLGDAFLSVETTVREDGRKRHALRFDTGLLRNTEAHGKGFRCGFVVHIEP